MGIDESQIEREKDRLPRGWGRFGKALSHLAEVAQPGESLLSTCIGINPEFKISGSLSEPSVGLAAGAVAGRMAGIAAAATKDTNLLLAATDQRIIAMATGLRGDPREHASIPYEGLELAAVEKKKISLRWPEGSLQLGGIHKKQLPAFLEAIQAQTAKP
jgi:hypothetical protein